MANAITKQTIVDGSRILVVKAHISGDGSGEEADTVLIDASAYTPASTNIKIVKAQSNLSGFAAHLIWDATVNVDAITIAEGDSENDFSKFGGVNNNAGAGKTGDILLTTLGLGDGDEGTIIFTMEKK